MGVITISKIRTLAMLHFAPPFLELMRMIMMYRKYSIEVNHPFFIVCTFMGVIGTIRNNLSSWDFKA